MKLNSIAIIILVIITSCNPKTKISDLYNYNLSKIGEYPIHFSYQDKVRIIQYNPFGYPDYVLSISKTGERYLKELKIVYDLDQDSFFCQGIIVNESVFSSKWDSIITICNSMFLEKNNHLSNDGPNWVLEAYINQKYYTAEGTFCNSMTWINDLFSLYPNKEVELRPLECE